MKRQNLFSIYFVLLMSLLVAGCSPGKFIPQGECLLDNLKVESNNKEIKPSQMSVYVRQTPNAKWFSLFKLPMHIYCASGSDSTKWMNRFLRRLGDAPVIYDRAKAVETQAEMQKAIQNMGYMGATVRLKEDRISNNKVRVKYVIDAGKPYIVDRLSYNINDYRIHDYLFADTTRTLLHEGMRFNVNVLNDERQRITNLLHDNGYYRFHKDFITYRADTALNTYKVQLAMNLLPYKKKKEDAPTPHKQFKVRSVNYVLDADLVSMSTDTRPKDSLQYGGLNVFYSDKPFLRPKVLWNANFIRPGELYTNRGVRKTYSALGRLPILKFSNIRFEEVEHNDSIYLDAYVALARNKNQSFSFEVEGTNSAGDLGAAASVEYTHRNIFRGSETFSIKLRGAYEAVTGIDDYVNSNYLEYGIESSLNFPEFKFPFLSSAFKRRINATSEVSAKYNWQIRPEFERTSASSAWSYRWQGKPGAAHRFDLLDISYIYMPKVSATFSDYLQRMAAINPLVVYAYKDVFIVRMGYTYTYNSRGKSTGSSLQNSYSFRFNIEESGNLLYGISKVFNKHPKDGDAFKLANIDFAQYVKMDVDFAKNFVIDDRNSFVFHTGLGIAVPYGNSKNLPFEKQYFSGGANSVRGWKVRSLGPGSFGGLGNSADYIMNTGNIKLDLNLEYRTFLFWKLNGAAFIDAGNIWNLPGKGLSSEGNFNFVNFYKELAVSYGLGIRFDLDFLILRFDAGMKAVNPMYKGRDKFPITSPNFKRDFAFHFAVGYPF